MTVWIVYYHEEYSSGIHVVDIFSTRELALDYIEKYGRQPWKPWMEYTEWEVQDDAPST